MRLHGMRRTPWCGMSFAATEMLRKSTDGANSGEWQNREDARLAAEVKEAEAMAEKDGAQWTNRQVHESEARLRQRDAARYRDWEQWVLLNTPPSGTART